MLSAVAHFESLGGVVRLDQAKVPTFLFIANKRLIRRDLKHLTELTTLFELHLRDCKLKDSIWQHILCNDTLRILDLRGAGITDESLDNLSRFSKLTDIDLRETRISDSGMARLSECGSLRSLNLIGTLVTDRGLESLVRLIKLESLSLVHTLVSDHGLRHIAKMQSLKHLDLEGTRITDAGLENLAPLSKLEHLSIHNNHDVTEEALKHLIPLRNLKTLYFCEPITNNGLSYLKTMSKLAELYIAPETDDVQRNLIEMNLPNTEIY